MGKITVKNMPSKEEYEQQKRQKEKRREKEARKQQQMRIGRWFLIAAAILAVIAGSVWAISNSGAADVEEEDIISRNGIHRHSELSIVVNGEKQEIPANIGLGATQHNPVHTHDSDNVIHLEHSGLVTVDDIRLKQFFEVWGRQFSEKCIFDYCNTGEKQVKMFVNGERSEEFGEYILEDGDNIEIIYGTTTSDRNETPPDGAATTSSES